MRRLLAILGLLCCFPLLAAERIPPAPPSHFNDYAHKVSAATAERLDRTLGDFERETSSQIVVAVYPKMESDSSIEDYAVRVFRAWGIGLTNKNNGALLLVFVDDHKMRIATGYGLEGALPDALCKRILDDEITPRFRNGDFDGGLSAGVAAMLAATKGEYVGTGRTVNDNLGRNRGSNSNSFARLIPFIIFALILFTMFRSRSRGRGFLTGWMIGSGGFGGWSGGGGSGGGWSGGGGGGGFSGGGGGFSGGGGSTGGGGASGSW